MPKKKDENERKSEGSYCQNCMSPSSFYLYSPIDCDNYRGAPIRFYTGTCNRCDAVAVFTVSVDEHGNDRGTLVRAYPTSRNSLSCPLPPEAQRSYDEAIRCEESGASLATVVMVGRTLEAVCKEHFPDPKNLSIFAGIDRLHRDGVISDQLKLWADQLRVLRNIGAHATNDAVTIDDAREAMDFMKAILENVYDLGPKFKQFVARRTPTPQ
jgi:Domain of unknown function (DUF4145)